MKKWIKIIALTASVAILGSIACKVVDDDGDANTMAQLKIENGEVTGWNTVAGNSGFIEFIPSTMDAKVNGGASEYINKGLVEGFEQNMQKDGTERTYRSWIIDFGTAEKAAVMFNEKVNKYQSTKEAAGSYAATTAFIVPTDYGYDAYANFTHYYVWMSFDSYGTNKSEAKNNALGFLAMTQGKIETMK